MLSVEIVARTEIALLSQDESSSYYVPMLTESPLQGLYRGGSPTTVQT